MRNICDLIYTVTAFTLLLVEASCSHFQKNNKFISINELSSNLTDVETIDLSDRQKFESFLESVEKDFAIAKTNGKVPPHTWSKIGQTLEAYKSLIHLRSNDRLWIPEKTNLKIQINSFCIDPSRSAPESNEVFEWVSGEPSIPLYSKILKYYSTHLGVGREPVQELIWNLSNKTYYENYPGRLKNLLNKIDPDAATKLPSAMREKVVEVGASILENISGTDLHGPISLVRGQYYEYEQFRENIESFRSSYSLSDKNTFFKIFETDLVVTSYSDGYQNQILSFYNLAETARTIDLGKYYLKPLRKDVQRIALASVAGESSYFISRLNQFFRQTLSELGVLYPNLTDEEKALIRKYPYESLRVAWHQARSEFAMGRFFKGGSIDGEADAFRHFAWAGFLTHDLGKILAQQYLNAHESAHPFSFPGRRMDEHNNKKGAEAALNLDEQNRFSAKNLYHEAFKSLRNRELTILKPTGELPDDSSY